MAADEGQAPASSGAKAAESSNVRGEPLSGSPEARFETSRETPGVAPEATHREAGVIYNIQVVNSTIGAVTAGERAQASGHIQASDVKAWTDVVRSMHEGMESVSIAPRPIDAQVNRQGAPTTTLLAPNNLSRRRVFVGREQSLSILEKTLEHAQMASVFALAGTGKTALALEYAHRAVIGGGYPGGVFWVLAEGAPIDTMTRLAAVLRSCVPSLRDHLPRDASAEEQAEATRVVLQSHPFPSLLVLDNVTETGLEGYLPGGAVRVLATVRDKAWSVGESIALDPLDAGESRALVNALAGGPAGGAESEACDRVVQQALGGLAAAVEVAARAVKAWAGSWIAYEDYLRNRSAVVLDDVRDRSQHYPRGVFAAIDLSIDRCQDTSPERDLIVGASMFAPDAVPREWLFAVTGVNTREVEGRRALATLLGLGLVKVDPKTAALSMHPLVQRRLRERFGEHQWKMLSCVRTWLSETVGRTREQMQLIDERRAHIDEALKAAERLGHDEDWIDIANGLARHFRYRGRYGESLALSARAVKQARARDARGDAYAVSLSNQALVLQALGRAEEAIPLLEEALRVLDDAGHAEDLRVALGRSNLARVLHDIGDDERARSLFESVLAITEKLQGPEHPEVAKSLSNLAGVLAYMGETDRALSLLQRARAIAEKHCAPDDPGTVTILSTLSVALRDAGQADEALLLAERVLETEENTYGLHHPKVAKGLLRLASALRDVGRPAEARPLLLRAQQIAESTFGADQEQLAGVRERFGALLRNLGEVAIDDDETVELPRNALLHFFDELTRVTHVVQPQPGGDAPRSTTDCLVVIYSKEPTLLGKRFVLENNPTRVGRGADNHILLDGDAVSRRHAHFEQRGPGWGVADQGSTNGTYCNDEQISRDVVLRNGDRVKIGPTIFKFLSGADVEAQYHEEIYRMTIIDGLTQIHNKRYFYEALEREILRARRHERGLAILLFDIDHFERINEVHGHLAGDFVLKELARIVQARIRRDEVFARYGGEEFSIILPETSLEGAVALGETLRQKVSEHVFVFQEDVIKVTISVGATLLKDSDRIGNDLIKRADGRLSFAKDNGRNRVCA
ncbi:GGDEF family protein [Minicystis rosea]|nr:GGDEF family protein [Minicystis rosea]